MGIEKMKLIRGLFLATVRGQLENEPTTTATTVTADPGELAASECDINQLKLLEGNYGTGDKWGRRLKIAKEVNDCSTFKLTWTTFSGITIKSANKQLMVNWPEFTYKGYSGLSGGKRHENGDVTITGIDFFAGQWIKETV